MLSLILLFSFIIGLEIGSFLNCVIYRLDKKESPLQGRSFCPHCHHKLSWLDLIPVFSFFVLKGKCRYCHDKISWQYPLVEIATGFLFAFIIGQSSLALQSFFLIILSCFLIIIFVYDLKHYLIPDKVIYPAIIIGLVYQVFEVLKFGFNNLNFDSFLYALFSAGLASAFFFSIFLISQGKWMGFGDVKLAFFLGLVLGWPNTFVAMFIAFLIGALIGTGLIALKRKTLKSEVPFAPFLIIGTFIALFWGDKIIEWYTSFILY